MEFFRLTQLYFPLFFPPLFAEYGLVGLVSKHGDVYSYGILLMETFTQKKPTDEMFVGEFSIKH